MCDSISTEGYQCVAEHIFPFYKAMLEDFPAGKFADNLISVARDEINKEHKALRISPLTYDTVRVFPRVSMQDETFYQVEHHEIVIRFYKKGVI